MSEILLLTIYDVWPPVYSIFNIKIILDIQLLYTLRLTINNINYKETLL